MIKAIRKFFKNPLVIEFIRKVFNPKGADVKKWLIGVSITYLIFSVNLFLTATNFDHTELYTLFMSMMTSAIIFMKWGK